MADLRVNLLGLHFRNPILPGAGPHVDATDDLLSVLEAGVGGLVVRTAHPRPLPTPPEPSTVLFGKDSVLSQRYGSSRRTGEGVMQVRPMARMQGVPVIASLSGPAAEIAFLGRRLALSGADALEYSSAGMDWADAVAAVKALREAVGDPLIVKLSLEHGEEIADRAAELAPYADAFTCIAGFGPVLDIDVDAGGAPRLGGPLGYGYLSGAAIHPIAVRAVFQVARRVGKPVIASGGALTAADVVEFLEAGASLVQVTTAAILHGPSIYGRLVTDLDNWLNQHGHASVAGVQGLYVKRFGHGQRVVTAHEETPALSSDLCVKCALCGRVCMYGAVEAPLGHLPVFDPVACFQCGLCVSVCPENALSLRPRTQTTMLPPP